MSERRLPEIIKVGGIKYSITETDLSPYDADGSYRMGNHKEAEALIEIREEMPLQKKEQTLVHELMHAIFAEMGINIENEEDIVNRAGLMLYQVLKDNDFSWVSD